MIRPVHGSNGWSDANHRTRFYDRLSEQLKDNLAISDRPITLLQELKAAAQVLDQHMRQCKAEKNGHTYHTTSQAPAKDPNAMEVEDEITELWRRQKMALSDSTTHGR